MCNHSCSRGNCLEKYLWSQVTITITSEIFIDWYCGWAAAPHSRRQQEHKLSNPRCRAKPPSSTVWLLYLPPLKRATLRRSVRYCAILVHYRVSTHKNLGKDSLRYDGKRHHVVSKVSLEHRRLSAKRRGLNRRSKSVSKSCNLVDRPVLSLRFWALVSPLFFLAP